MTPQEFNKMVGKEVTDKEHNIIQTVYTFHPAINDVDGKGQIAKLYLEFGMTIIEDMLPRAEKMMLLERELFKAQTELDRIKNEIVKNSQCKYS
jgi:hypothetical protein